MGEVHTIVYIYIRILQKYWMENGRTDLIMNNILIFSKIKFITRAIAWGGWQKVRVQYIGGSKT